MTEDQIATVLCDTLKGLEYLHLRKKIHRDIKASGYLCYVCFGGHVWSSGQDKVTMGRMSRNL